MQIKKIPLFFPLYISRFSAVRKTLISAEKNNQCSPWDAHMIHPPYPNKKVGYIFPYWLVVDLPLWKIWKSVGSIIPNIWRKTNVLNHQPAYIPPTRLVLLRASSVSKDPLADPDSPEETGMAKSVESCGAGADDFGFWLQDMKSRIVHQDPRIDCTSV